MMKISRRKKGGTNTLSEGAAASSEYHLVERGRRRANRGLANIAANSEWNAVT